MALRRFFPLQNYTTSVSPPFPQLQNPSWELDMQFWTSLPDANAGSWSIRTDRPTDGAKSAWFTGSGPGNTQGAIWELENQTTGPVTPGDAITAQVDIALDTPDKSLTQGMVELAWYTSGMTLISVSTGTLIHGDTKGAWHTSTITANAPSGAAFVKLRVWVTANAYGGVLVDNSRWYRQKDGPPGSSGGSGGGFGVFNGVRRIGTELQ